MELREAMLDGKDLNPENIITDITNNRYIMNNGSAVGFISDIPVIFTWHDNYMQLTFALCSQMREALGNVKETSEMIMEYGNKNIDVSYFQNIIWLTTYWIIK